LAVPYVLSGILSTFKLVKQNNYDLLHVNWPFPLGLLGVVGKWFSRSKLVLTFYGAEFALIKKVPLGKFIAKFIVNRADGVIAISKFTKGELTKIVKTKVLVIPFTSGLEAKAAKVKTEGTTKTILFVGRLIERKGVVYMIKAMPEILKKVKARLEIVGAGLLRSELEGKAKKLGINKEVVFHGRVSAQKLASLYRSSSVFVLPAITDRWGDTEGLGVVLLEAMSFGKPVVASKVGGIVDIVDDNKTGLLVKQKDSLGLAKAITKVLTDEELAVKLAKNGQRLVNSRFSWHNITRDTINFYDKVTG
jgi:glycosyltransferase involved in cell wall biosynthesis